MSEVSPAVERGRVLLVDDDEQLRFALARLLRANYAVQAVPTAEAAVAALRAQNFDAMLVDVHLQGTGGLELLREVRQLDLDLPVVLMTGSPSLETAVRAVEYGAMKYLFKPLDTAALRQTLDSAIGLRKLALAKRASQRLLGRPETHAADLAGLEANFNVALRSLRMNYQPVISWASKRSIGYEALLRVSGAGQLRDPGSVLDAAERLGRLHELGRAVRSEIGAGCSTLPGDTDVYVNLHPEDLSDEDLYDPKAPLARIAERVVLEITERASLHSISDVRGRAARLREMGFRIAVDDLGAGYAGLASFAQLEPEVVKFDMALVRDIHHQPMKRKLVASMAAACRDLRVLVVAEGVELPAERDALLECGCDLMQGYLFAKPGPPFPEAQL